MLNPGFRVSSSKDFNIRAYPRNPRKKYGFAIFALFCGKNPEKDR
jgi:hypothetical protein